MNQPFYRQTACALLISVSALYASDPSASCKIVGLLHQLGQPQAEKNHKALHQQKEEIKGCCGPDLNAFTDRWDQLIELAVFTATVDSLKIFDRSVQQVQPGDGCCAWCKAGKDRLIVCGKIQIDYQQQVKKDGSMKLCDYCYEQKLYTSIVSEDQLTYINSKQDLCLSCDYRNVVKGVGVRVLVKEVLNQLKYSSHINICAGNPFCKGIQEFAKDRHGQDRASYIMKAYIEYLVHRIELFSEDKIIVKASLLEEVQAKKLLDLLKTYPKPLQKKRFLDLLKAHAEHLRAKKLPDLLKAYADHLNEVSIQLSDRAQLKALKGYVLMSENKIGAVKGFLDRKSLIEQLYNALCMSQKQVEQAIYAIE